MKDETTDFSGETYHLTRRFSAPVSLVWRCLTEPELLSRWYGPGVETAIHGFDLRVGGAWLTEMIMNGNSMYQRADFTAVTEGESYSCTQATTDKDWNIIDNPMMPDWPKLLDLTISLKAIDTGTQLDLSWTPRDANDAERNMFVDSIQRMGGGWSMGMDILEEMLGEMS